MPSAVTDDELHAALAAFRAGARHDTLDTGRYRMRYFVWGSGPPVVFVHGMSDAARAFVMVMHRLVERHTCVAYELPDGLTDESALARYTAADYAADLFSLLDHLGFPLAAVVGSSFGSPIVLSALSAAPHRFAHGVLQNGFSRRPLTRFQKRLCQNARFLPWQYDDWPEIYARVMRRVERPSFAVMPPAVAAFFLRCGGRTPVRAACLRTLAIGRTDLRPLLPTIRTPVLLLTGDHDPLVPPVCAKELEGGLPDVRRVEFADCGHYPQYTHPRAMAEAIDKFLHPAGDRGTG